MINATVLAVIILVGCVLGAAGLLAWGWDFALGIAWGFLLFGMIGATSPTFREWLAVQDDRIADEKLWSRAKKKVSA
jgi:hypothetical protein